MTVIRTEIGDAWHYLCVGKDLVPFLYPSLDMAEQYEYREIAQFACTSIAEFPQFKDHQLQLHTFQLEKVS